eukprot:2169912-Rhodomonas_salina.1
MRHFIAQSRLLSTALRVSVSSLVEGEGGDGGADPLLPARARGDWARPLPRAFGARPSSLPPSAFTAT